MAAHKIDIHYVADLARLALTGDEAERYAGQLDSVLEHIEQLQKLDVATIEPTAHGAPVYNVFRQDETEPSLSVEAVIANAPQSGNNLIVVPKIVE